MSSRASQQGWVPKPAVHLVGFEPGTVQFYDSALTQ